MKNASFTILLGCLIVPAGCGESATPNAPPPQDAAVGFAQAVRMTIDDLETAESPGGVAQGLVEMLEQAEENAGEQHKAVYGEMEPIAREIVTISESGAGREKIMQKVEELKQLSQKLPGSAPPAAQ